MLPFTLEFRWRDGASAGGCHPRRRAGWLPRRRIGSSDAPPRRETLGVVGVAGIVVRRSDPERSLGSATKSWPSSPRRRRSGPRRQQRAGPPPRRRAGRTVAIGTSADGQGWWACRSAVYRPWRLDPSMLSRSSRWWHWACSRPRSARSCCSGSSPGRERDSPVQQLPGAALRRVLGRSAPGRGTAAARPRRVGVGAGRSGGPATAGGEGGRGSWPIGRRDWNWVLRPPLAELRLPDGGRGGPNRQVTAYLRLSPIEFGLFICHNDGRRHTLFIARRGVDLRFALPLLQRRA